MGLFSNSKKGCPVCGEATPRLFPTKVEGAPICKECSKKIFLPEGMLDSMTIDSFRQYMNYYENNNSLREGFTKTYDFYFPVGVSDVVLDTSKGLFRLKDDKNALVFQASCIKSFRIFEGNDLLFESQGNKLKCYESDVPDKVRGMHSVLEQFKARRQQYEFMKNMERREEEAARQRGETYQGRYISEPAFDGNEPFDNFRLEMVMDDPYWSIFIGEVYGPKFNRTHPSIDSFIRDYQNAAEKIHDLAANLMQFMCPGAGEIRSGSMAEGTAVIGQMQPETTSGGSDAIGEIKKYKELLDAGIITEEEFALKKRQLLGL